MSKKPPAMVDFKFSEDTIDETTGEENPNFIYDTGLKLELEDDEDLDDHQVLIKIEEKMIYSKICLRRLRNRRLTRLRNQGNR